MKHFAKILVTAVASLAFTASAFAGVPAQEPKLPNDLETAWQLIGQGACTPKEGVVISQKNYAQPNAEGLFNLTSVSRKNDQIVAVTTSDSFIPGMGMIGGAAVVKEGDKWMSYDLSAEGEEAKAVAALYAGWGVTKEELAEKCGK